MKRRAVVWASIAVATLLLVVAWLRWGDDLRARYVLWRCVRAWERVADYEARTDVSARVGLLKVTLGGTLAHRKPDAYRLDLGGGLVPKCRFTGVGDTAWVYFPQLKTALEVDFETGGAAQVAEGESVKPWVDEALKGARPAWLGTQVVNGRTCDVVALAPAPRAQSDGAPAIMPMLGERFRKVPFSRDWASTRLYLDRELGLPIRGEALKADGSPLLVWNARNLRVNIGLTQSDFRFQPEPGVKVLKRRYDPDHPEDLLIPPGKRREYLDRLERALREL
jgi:hypothetical protein